MLAVAWFYLIVMMHLLALLSQKRLERPRLLQRIRNEITDPNRAHLTVFNSTPLERGLAVALAIPLNACDPDNVAHCIRAPFLCLMR